MQQDIRRGLAVFVTFAAFVFLIWRLPDLRASTESGSLTEPVPVLRHSVLLGLKALSSQDIESFDVGVAVARLQMDKHRRVGGECYGITSKT